MFATPHGVVSEVITLHGDVFYSGQNLRNEEQVAIIQASTVLSLAEKVSAEGLG